MFPDLRGACGRLILKIFFQATRETPMRPAALTRATVAPAEHSTNVLRVGLFQPIEGLFFFVAHLAEPLQRDFLQFPDWLPSANLAFHQTERLAGEPGPHLLEADPLGLLRSFKFPVRPRACAWLVHVAAEARIVVDAADQQEPVAVQPIRFLQVVDRPENGRPGPMVQPAENEAKP